MAAFSVSNGYMLSVSATIAPGHVHPLWKDKCGRVSGTAIVYGAFTGAMVALAFTNIGTHPTSN